MKSFTHLLAIVLVAAALAGCANNEPTTTTPTPTPTASPSVTPTASPTVPIVTPTVTPPVTPTVTPPVVAPTVTAVYVTSLTDSLPSAGTANVCWRVEGTGSIPHTAVHYDTTSHPNPTGFGDYVGGAVYPDNGAPTGRTFALPATFCGELRDLNATTYLRPHALAPGTTINTLGPEKAVLVANTSNITLVNFLEVFPATFNNSVCWRVSGLTGTTTHTAIHFDDEPHADPTVFSVYDGGAAYANNSPAAGFNVTVPGEFCANLTMPATGNVVYLRAHIIHNGAHYLSEERNVYAAPRVTVSGGLPATAAANSDVNVCWRVEGSGTTQHTAIHWDTTSHPASTAFGDYVGGAVYPENAAPTAAPWTLPGPHCADLTMPASGSIFFRPHVIYAAPGGQELGPEYSIRVA